MTFNPCWLDEEGGEARLREIGLRKNEWTALDVLALEEVSAGDRLWAVLREDFLSKNTLYEFALLCAEHALTIAKVTDERCWNVIKVKRAWMHGEASDDELDTAWAAARDAEWVVARVLARDVEWVVASYAAGVARKVKGRKGYSREIAWQVETLKRMIVENEKEG